MTTFKKVVRSVFFLFVFISANCFAQGTWSSVTNVAPDYNGGVMLLLSDGTVIAKTYTGGSDSMGVVWDRLIPDTNGSYINGRWDTIASMHDSRLYFGSQVLTDGRVYVGGGEYGTGAYLAEVYNPVTNSWTPTPSTGHFFADANSKILPDGKVLHATLDGSGDQTYIYDPGTNTWGSAPIMCHGGHDESSWVQLADASILFVDIGTQNSERYIPSLNQWVVDATVPDSLYDGNDYEMGAGFLLPDGRAWFMGATGHTAYYTPSGNTSPGTWAAGPDIPFGFGTTDAAAAMMVNGKILMCASPRPQFSNDYPSPTKYFEFDYLTDTYLQISAPGAGGADSLNIPCYYTNMLDLPNGQVLYCNQGDNQYYIYTPNGNPLPAGVPTIANVTAITCDTFRVRGTLFNGISEGAAYGDDWQMATNYPVVCLKNGPYVYYAKTFNWNRTGVQTGSLADTTYFTLPAGLQAGTYSLVLSANGIGSLSNTFVYTPCSVGIAENEKTGTTLSVYPNPANEMVTVSFKTNNPENYNVKVLDIFGRTVKEENARSISGENSHPLTLDALAKGVYMIVVKFGELTYKTKLILK
jgi:hypothetical protein